jgi:uncharacterized membrane protein YoaK (UPF0700 family)
MPVPLSRWIWAGGWILACIAGIINAVGLLSFEHQAVTHLTGTTTLLASALVDADVQRVGHLFAVILAYCTGAALSGVIIRNSAFKLGRRYGAVLLIESLLLLLTVALLDRNSPLGSYTASSAAGLQNGMVTTFSGAVIRTTHVSGMFTDLGVMLGHVIQRIRPSGVEKTRVQVSLIVISAFFSGGLIGAAGFRQAGHAILFLPAALTFAGAAVYTLYWIVSKRRALKDTHDGASVA